MYYGERPTPKKNCCSKYSTSSVHSQMGKVVHFITLMRVWTESLTQAAPNSAITLLHSPRSQSLQGPLFQNFPSLVHFSFPSMLCPRQEKGGVSQSLASVAIDRLTAPVAICARPAERCSTASSSRGLLHWSHHVQRSLRRRAHSLTHKSLKTDTRGGKKSREWLFIPSQNLTVTLKLQTVNSKLKFSD